MIIALTQGSSKMSIAFCYGGKLTLGAVAIGESLIPFKEPKCLNMRTFKSNLCDILWNASYIERNVLYVFLFLHQNEQP